MKRPDFTASSVNENSSAICGAHFKDEDYVQGDLLSHRMGFKSLVHVRLVPGAVPSIQSPGGPGQTTTTTERSSAVVNKLGLSRVSFTLACISMLC